VSWYKKSKIVNLNPPTKFARPVLCKLCHRWEVENNGVTNWKHYSQMSPEEQMEVDHMQRLFNQGKSNFFIATCDYCKNKHELV